MVKRFKERPSIFRLQKLLFPFVMATVIVMLLHPSVIIAGDPADLIEPNRSFVLSKQEAQFINSLAPLRVMIDDKFAPLSYYDTKNRSFHGISVDLFRHVAEKIGLKYTLLHDAKLSWADKVERFKIRQIDLLMPTSYTAERAVSGLFTASIYDTYYGVIAKKKQ